MKNQILADYLGIERPCAGNGKCGKCRVNIQELESRLERRLFLSEPTDTEKRVLGDRLAEGIRLACQARLVGDIEAAELGSRSRHGSAAVEAEPEAAVKPHGIVCIDIGTTTLEACLLTDSGERIFAKPRLNPQRRFGADVISRIDAANRHFDELVNTLRAELRELISEFSPTYAIVTGNTVMLHFFAGLSVDGMRADPFTPASLFGETLDASSLGLGFDGEVYLPRCVSAFVGADTTCALLAADIRADENTLLVDLGTNGELAFVCNGKPVCASTAAGPALEGADISCGMRAEPGAIYSVRWRNGVSSDDRAVSGRFELEVIGDEKPIGICGSGLISAVAAMLDAGIVDESGYLEDDLELAEGVRIEPRDIRALQLAKGAIAAGIRILCGDTPIDRLCIAGNFGRGLELAACRRIGLIPDSVKDDMVEILGNAALEGAIMLAQGLHEPANARYLSLAEDDRFAETFTDCLLF